MNPMRSRRHGRPADEQAPDPARADGFIWFVALGAAAVAGFAIMALLYALGGRDAGAWAYWAMIGGFVLSLAPAMAPLFTKQRPSPSAAPGPLSAKRAAFISFSSIWMALYVLAISNVHGLLDISAWPRWAGFVAAIGAALPVGCVIYALLRYLIREADEYQRLLLTRAALIAAGVTLFVLTLWGLLELYVGAPHIPLSMALAPFCVVFAIANWWFRGRA
jgi:hypothetical protein